ncbi:ABC transporter substrate-binding protein [Kitasatospora viridis]|uniref:Carbohydrate ABC transporter substrate-binding protein (CUT1 family) n=1 Tax=Kitasatospora viridis TaxID=281105 RepID=A0A561TVH3_9ACTN|nr:ABC transporter substrate-binding protein [Kitasatospora viridis]TWF91109.1 carbohydrate ABC transporter substrate-binding protein (CUT1 family) [Kitasatospora viridis]
MTTKIDTGTRRSGVRHGRRMLVAAAGAALTLASVTACGGGSGGGKVADGFTQAPQGGGKLTVWVDSTRLAAAQLYQKEHPAVKLDIVTYDGDANGSNYLQTKVSLFNRTGSGWPDVVFSSQNNEATWAVSAGFAAPLDKGLVDPGVLSGFAPGANTPCTVDGTVYCLRNDLSQTVLWYNAPLMKQWGYSVPTTWEQYQQLGEKVATEHPGYLVGSVGDSYAPEVYMWASKCGANQVTGAKAVTVNTTSDACTKMATLLDTLIKDGTMSKSSVFSSDFDKNDAAKVLMMPGPAWYGSAVFQGTFKTPSGQITASPMPQWEGDSSPSVGNVGGGTWLLSAHSKDLKDATDFLTWVSTSDDYQGKVSPGYPAYMPAAKTWLAQQGASGYYAGDPAPALQAAAGQAWLGWGYPQYSQEAIWAATMTPQITAGKTIASQLPAWQTAIANYAKADGYQVTTQ